MVNNLNIGDRIKIITAVPLTYTLDLLGEPSSYVITESDYYVLQSYGLVQFLAGRIQPFTSGETVPVQADAGDYAVKIKRLQEKLAETDYKLIRDVSRIMRGVMTREQQEEFVLTEEQRQGWRDEINNLRGKGCAGANNECEQDEQYHGACFCQETY